MVGVGRNVHHGLVLEQVDDGVWVVHPSASGHAGGIGSRAVLGSSGGAGWSRRMARHGGAVSTLCHQRGVQEVHEVIDGQAGQSVLTLGFKAGKIRHVFVHESGVHTELRGLEGKGAAEV